MKTTTLLSAGAAVLLAVGCADTVPVEPAALTPMSVHAASRSPAPASDDNAEVSPVLAGMNAQLAAAGAGVRIAKAELLLHAKDWNNRNSTLLFANDRARGIGAEWVKGDPRRDGRTGVTYAFGSSTGVAPFQWNSTRTGFRASTLAEVNGFIEEGMAAWRARSCASKAITRVAVTPGTDPDVLDQILRGQNPNANYAQPADIVQAGWQPFSFFTGFAGSAGANILGVAFTFIFVDDATGVPTDIDGNRKDDTGLVEIFYNAGYLWGSDGSEDVLDFYSIIAHESGHAFGLGHFGKVFIHEKDLADGFQSSDVKYAPYALMNAVYVSGRNEITGTDNSSFCQIWASK